MDARQAKIMAHQRAQAKANGSFEIHPGFVKGFLIFVVIVALVIYGASDKDSTATWQREMDVQDARDDLQAEQDAMLRAAQKAHARWIAEQERKR